jgi:hypothetical protein
MRDFQVPRWSVAAGSAAVDGDGYDGGVLLLWTAVAAVGPRSFAPRSSRKPILLRAPD